MLDINKKIEKAIINSISVKEGILQNKKLIEKINLAVEILVQAFTENNKVLFCGNGGSAADAQHISAELSGRFLKDRDPLYAEALHVNSSYLTAVANDYSFDQVYSRLVKAKCNEGDVLFGISTSGNSKNVVNAIKEANILGVKTIGLVGRSKGLLSDICDLTINVPSQSTPRIQEAHILIGHIICENVESIIFSD